MPFSNGSYDSATVSMMHRALDAAWSEFEQRGRALAEPLAIRRLMAKRILSEVASGERDPERLRLLALKAADDRSIG